MYSVHCATCSERKRSDSYSAANDFFMEHAESRHDVELVNERRAAAE